MPRKKKTVLPVVPAEDIPNEHELKESIQIDVWYPDHPPRTTSDTFARSRKQMIEVEDQPCFICGSKNDRESHHWHLEWAYAEAVDWDKVKLAHPDFNWANFKEAEDFVDSVYNLLTLCESCHRHKDHGVHNLPYPIWIVQKYLKTGFRMFDSNHLDGPSSPAE